jgi:hypothetical protein
MCNQREKNSGPPLLHHLYSTHWPVVLSWHPPNPDWSVRLPGGEAWFITPENTFPLLQSPMAARFTLLQPTLGIAHGDLRFVCWCSAVGNHSMKLPTNSYCADVASRGSLVVSAATEDRLFLRASHSVVLFCELVWPTTSLLSRCCS